MYELIQLTDNDYYIDCPAKIGLVRINDREVVLIDSGSDKDAAKKVLKHIDANGWTLKAVYNTHSHADHIGGNKLLQDRTGCKIFAKGLEAAYTNSPALEPAGLYGGLPFKELKNKFLMAQESKCEELSEDKLPDGMKMLDLKGHCFEMVGLISKDGTAYIGDAVSSEDTLAKYGIGYLWDPDESVNTLQNLKNIDAKVFVPSHAAVTDDISLLADININAINSVKDKIKELLSEEKTFEALLKNIFDTYQLTMNAQQYVLIGSTLRSYLSALYTNGEIGYSFDNNEMLWKIK